jgi:DNA-binding Lrp family transcriptional regulator
VKTALYKRIFQKNWYKYLFLTKKYINNGKFFHSMELDKTDLRILEELSMNSKQTTSKLGKKLNIPITTIHNRIKKLEKEKIILSYGISLDYKKLGKPLTVFILLTVNYLLPNGRKTSEEEIAKKIKTLNVEEVSIVTGSTDLIVKLRVTDIDQLNDFVGKKLRSIDGVDKAQTLMVLNTF